MVFKKFSKISKKMKNLATTFTYADKFASYPGNDKWRISDSLPIFVSLDPRKKA